MLFGTEVTDRLEPQHILRLSAGVVAAVRVRDFFTRHQCQEVMRALEGCEMGSYDERFVQPRVAKLGPAAYDYYGNNGLTAEYWDYGDRSAKARATLLHGEDPLDLAADRLREGWHDDVRRATSGGRPMFAGMIREINQGARMHFDEVVREFPGLLDEIPVCQLAFNCFLSMPEGGGESVVFRRRWRPSDEGHRDGYGYDSALAEDQPVAEVRAELGDGVLFDPRNYHLVRPNAGSGRRVTLSFFIGITTRGPLHIWS
ncbi:2OG-Fe(II)-dependent halogenase WelO5 family protein [Acrocarpospora catenulata]|uniref:2OG-Fe(II)-dependent halogenase WelO5 family protein n=1 Tax=Acrocarpospora catenulata TaxID=2836182 RepID=UPI001BDA3A88|nr:hypothetical protein [Acrocarpospora catenulata]